MQLLGAHMSIAGGHALAIDRATEYGMTACQIFTKNANQWAAKPIAAEQAEAFRARVAASEVGFIVAHDSYLINLASPDETLREKSRLAFRDELDRCDTRRARMLSASLMAGKPPRCVRGCWRRPGIRSRSATPIWRRP